MNIPDPSMTTDLPQKPTIPPVPKCVFCWDKGEIDYLHIGKLVKVPCPDCRPMEYREAFSRLYNNAIVVKCCDKL